MRQLLPDRLEDFASHYEKSRTRKALTFENYKIEDYLQGLTVSNPNTFPATRIVGPEAAIPQFRQQLAILNSAAARFESSLFEIRQLVQADLLDSDLEEAEFLAKNKFTRAGGALAGVSLEKHLSQVCNNHGVKLPKKDPKSRNSTMHCEQQTSTTSHSGARSNISLTCATFETTTKPESQPQTKSTN